MPTKKAKDAVAENVSEIDAVAENVSEMDAVTEGSVDSIVEEEQVNTETPNTDSLETEEELFDEEAQAAIQQIEADEHAEDISEVEKMIADTNVPKLSEIADKADKEDDSVSSQRMVKLNRGNGGSMMSDDMYALFRAAFFNKEVLEAELTGVERTTAGIAAVLSFNSNDKNIAGRNRVTVKIGADKMGLDIPMMQARIEEINLRRGVEVDEDTFSAQLENYKFNFLTAMLGASIEFVTTEIMKSVNTVVGDREEALKRRRRRFIPRTFADGTSFSYQVGSILRAKVLVVEHRRLYVSVSGYDFFMKEGQISPLAFELESTFKPGDAFAVKLTKVTEDGIAAIGAEGADIDIYSRIHEYPKGATALVTIIGRRIGRGYDLEMPNGCRGIASQNTVALDMNIKAGDRVKALVMGHSNSHNLVLCKFVRPRSTTRAYK